jgi:anti-anti-sigma regulatory factor
MRLLGAETHAILELSWLAQTDVSGACLGLWERSSAGAAGRLTLPGSYAREGGTSARRGSSCPAAQFPPADAIQSAAGAGDITLVLPVRSAAHDWGYLVLRTPARDTLLAENRLTWASLLGVALDRTALVDSLTAQQGALREQQETLRAAYERERALADTIRELGSPVIPLLPRVLLVPLIGAIGTDRAQQIVEVVLEGVQRHQAHTVLLDVTGVPLVDTQVAGALVRVAQAAGLLGSQVIMVGIRPEMAQSIVALGIELRNIGAQPSLAAALQQILARASHS